MKTRSVVLETKTVLALLAGGLHEIDLPPWRFNPPRRTPSPRVHLNPGDLLWVKERFIEFTHRRREGLWAMGYGNLIQAQQPGWYDEHTKVFMRPATAMWRRHSRLTLKVVEMAADGAVTVCEAVAQNVAAYLEARKAEQASLAVAAGALAP